MTEPDAGQSTATVPDILKGRPKETGHDKDSNRISRATALGRRHCMGVTDAVGRDHRSSPRRLATDAPCRGRRPGLNGHNGPDSGAGTRRHSSSGIRASGPCRLQQAPQKCQPNLTERTKGATLHGVAPIRFPPSFLDRKKVHHSHPRLGAFCRLTLHKHAPSAAVMARHLKSPYQLR